MMLARCGVRGLVLTCGVLAAACRGPITPAASATAPQDSAAAVLDTPEATPAAPQAGDLVVATANMRPVYASDVRARQQRPGVDGTLEALGAAVLDVIALRELAQLEQRPAPGETVAAAVDRLLPLVFASHGCVGVSPDDVRRRFVAELARWRHPPRRTAWMLELRCCADGPCTGRDRCVADHGPAIARVEAALRGAPVPAAQAAGESPAAPESWERSPCLREAALEFERVAADVGARGSVAGDARSTASRAGPAWTLTRAHAYLRGDRRFPERSFPRVEPALETALGSAALCQPTGPVATLRGVAFAMVVDAQPAQWGGPEDATIAAQIRAVLCDEGAVLARDAWLQRLGASATVTWDHAAIRARWGDAVADRLRPWAAVTSRSGRTP